MPSSPDPERVREALEQHRDGVAGTHQYDELAWAARAWLAGSSPDYEAAWNHYWHRKSDDAEPLPEGDGFTHFCNAVDAAFPGLFEERP